MNIEQYLIEQFGNKIHLETLDPKTFRLYIPAFHEDGDMMSIYITQNKDSFTVRDFGNTLMRLSYTFDFNTKYKQEILTGIICSSRAELDGDEILLQSSGTDLYPSILQYIQVVSKVSNMDILRRETVKTLFYEHLSDFVHADLSQYNPASKLYPVPSRQDLAVDWVFQAGKKPIFLYGVRDSSKAKDVTICCLEFLRASLTFSSIVVYEDFYSLTKNEQIRLTNVADKQFMSFDDFKSDGRQYIERAIA